MPDFTINIYKRLLIALKKQGFFVITFDQYLTALSQAKFVILRHDVDRLPENSLKTAKLEHEFGIKGTYYFRSVPGSYDERIIKQIAELGHEIGYHYENLSEICKKYKVGSKQKALFNREPETRSQKADVREQMVENGRMEDQKNGKLEVRNAEIRYQTSENRWWKTESWKTKRTENWKLGMQKAEIRCQTSENRWMKMLE